MTTSATAVLQLTTERRCHAIGLYTKTVLSVIAAALVYLCVALLPTGAPVTAQADGQRVVIASLKNEGGRVPSSRTAGLPVAFTGAGAVGLTMTKALDRRLRWFSGESLIHSSTELVDAHPVSGDDSKGQAMLTYGECRSTLLLAHGGE
jgi:hypothetical protein